MKLVRIIPMVTLVWLAGTIAPGYAQRDQQEERPNRGEDRGKSERQARPERRQGGSQQQQRAEPPGQQRRQQQAEPQQEQRVQQPQAQPRQEQRSQRPQAEPQQPRRADVPQRTQQSQPAPVQRAQQGDPRGRGNYPSQQRTQQQAAAWQQQRGWAQNGAWAEHSNWQQSRAQHWQSDHRTWGQRGGYGGYYIPEDRFRLYFGSQNWFRIQTRPIIVGGYPRFHYGDYWFMLVDPWPEYWADNWYALDDVYVDYDDGYYLYSRRYPGVGIAISVVL